jgi:hypothetical protein
MQCRACGAEMRLMQFVLGDTTGRVPAIDGKISSVRPAHRWPAAWSSATL